MARRRPEVALVLSGGGARAAYQVGVLRALAKLRPKQAPLPFSILCGTSAGAINAAGLAVHADRFDRAVGLLTRVWANLRCETVFRVGPSSLLRGVAGLLGRLDSEGRPRALLDVTPLETLLAGTLDFDAVRDHLAAGRLGALSITASSYTTGSSVSFFDGAEPIAPWTRARRYGRRTTLGVEHVLASCAIPLLFPPRVIGDEAFGDGAVQDLAPLSAALHLGADKILVIGLSDPPQVGRPTGAPAIPSLAQIGGRLFDAVFLDALEADLERLDRFNAALGGRDAGAGDLRRIETLVIRPSRDLGTLAARHLQAFPRFTRLLLARLGAGKAPNALLASYLLFEKLYCRDLMRLGWHDAMAQADALVALFADAPETPARALRPQYTADATA